MTVVCLSFTALYGQFNIFLGSLSLVFSGFLHEVISFLHLKADSLSFAEISFLLLFGQRGHVIFNRTF